MRTKVKWNDAINMVEDTTGVTFRDKTSGSTYKLNTFFQKVYFSDTDYDVYKGAFDGASTPNTDFIEVNDNACTLFQTYFLPYIFSSSELYAFSYDEDDLEEDENYPKSEANRLFARIYSFLRSSQEKYSPLLDAYEAMKDKLFDEVTSKEGISLMPQSSDMSELGGTSDDLSKAVIRKDDGGTAMQRLAEIQSAYRAVYEEWFNEMKGAFSLWR